MEVTLKEMKASDEIIIRTRFSDYCFRVIDPIQCRGVLKGGLLGTEVQEAIFVETIRPASSTNRLGQLEPGARAVFLLGTNTLNRLTTSVITEIVLSEAPEAPADDC